jgi:hypothetical protein
MEEPIFFSYDGSFLVFSYAYVSQFYDAFFFYHKASLLMFFYYELFFQLFYPILNF